MSVLITGSEGFIGSHLRKKIKGAKRVDQKIGKSIHGKLPKADVVIHLAAEPMVQYSIEKPYHSFWVNVNGTMNVLEHCRKTGAKIIFASSSQAEPDAKNPYALQKYLDELLIKQYGELYGVEYCIFRIYNVFGKGEHGVIGAFQKAKAKGEPLVVKGGEQVRDFIHVDAVTDILAGAVLKDLKGEYELGSGRGISIQQIADMISLNQIHEPLPEGEPLHIQAPYKTPTITVEEYLS